MIAKGPYINIWGSPDIGENTEVGAYVEIGGPSTVGDFCSIQAKVFIPPGVTIEDHVFIGPGAVFTNCTYPEARLRGFVPERTLVKTGARIGANVTVLPGVVIGARAIIGAGVTVLRSVDDDETYVGK